MSERACWAELVVPTINSSRWIEPLVAAYRDAGALPLLVDRQSADGTLQAIARAGGRAIGVDLAAPRVETLIPQIRNFVRSGWVLRVDDDEYPSSGLFEWLRGAEPRADVDSVAIQRRWLRRSAEGHLQRADCRLWIDSSGEVGGDRQWRAFHTERVNYLTDLHTPGFAPASWEKAPADAFLVHFDWLLMIRGRAYCKDGALRSTNSRQRHPTLDVLPPGDDSAAGHHLAWTRHEEFDGLAGVFISASAITPRSNSPG